MNAESQGWFIEVGEVRYSAVRLVSTFVLLCFAGVAGLIASLMQAERTLSSEFANDNPRRSDEGPIKPEVGETSSSLAPYNLNEYSVILVDGYAPSPFHWAGRAWRVNAGSTWVRDHYYSVMTSRSGAKVRFEIRDTNQDRSRSDPSHKRRSELSGSQGDSARLPNGVPLWGAFSFKHHPWVDPDGMKQTWGGVYGQIHMGKQFGGSPAVAFRRTADGQFLITTRGEFDADGAERYEAPLSFGDAHDLVYRLVLDPYDGSLKVWLDGKLVVNTSNVSIGNVAGGSYFNFGVYFSGGVTAPIIAEYANLAYPSASGLSARVSRKPAWPAN